MKVAVIGSRGLEVSDEEIERLLPQETTTLLSGGASGVDQCAKRYAHNHGIPILEFLPHYDRYGKAAPLRRNEEIIKEADYVLAFWNGASKGTRYSLDLCRKTGVPFLVITR